MVRSGLRAGPDLGRRRQMFGGSALARVEHRVVLVEDVRVHHLRGAIGRQVHVRKRCQLHERADEAPQQPATRGHLRRRIGHIVNGGHDRDAEAAIGEQHPADVARDPVVIGGRLQRREALRRTGQIVAEHVRRGRRLEVVDRKVLGPVGGRDQRAVLRVVADAEAGEAFVALGALERLPLVVGHTADEAEVAQAGHPGRECLRNPGKFLARHVVAGVEERLPALHYRDHVRERAVEGGRARGRLVLGPQREVACCHVFEELVRRDCEDDAEGAYDPGKPAVALPAGAARRHGGRGADGKLSLGPDCHLASENRRYDDRLQMP